MSKFARATGTFRQARSTKLETKQLNFFEESGALHADVFCGMVPDECDPNRFALAGMVFEIKLLDKHVGTSLALETLRQIHIHKRPIWAELDWTDEPEEVELWEAKVLVTFRPEDSNDDGTIRLSLRKKRLQMSLPDAGAWPNFGLAWIYSHTGCWKEMQNPTPWSGRICDCKPPIVKYRLRR